MELPSIVMALVAFGVVLLALRPSLIRAPRWRATVTPLASIIGSGFLVAGPILSHAAGNWAWLAMLGLCLIAYLFGSAVRHNIFYVEPLMENGPPRGVAVMERCSEFALAFAYLVSVAYYLNLFAAFALRAEDIVDPQLTRWVSSAVIGLLGLLGTFRGLGALENVEVGAVGIKLGLIAGLVAGLSVAIGSAVAHHSFALPTVAHDSGFHEIGVLLGLVILVQGFETSRFLGAAYDRETRVATMRTAQWLSSGIYLVFIVLATPFFSSTLPATGGETAIIDILAPLGSIVAPMIILAAIASQLSAAVADMNGAGGLLSAATSSRVSMRIGYALTTAVAIAITWTANIYEIIVFASKAFVVYYALQCSLAAFVAVRPGEGRSPVKAATFACGTMLSLMVLVFGVPAEGG
jgi:hypothetical protein